MRPTSFTRRTILKAGTAVASSSFAPASPLATLLAASTLPCSSATLLAVAPM